MPASLLWPVQQHRSFHSALIRVGHLQLTYSFYSCSQPPLSSVSSFIRPSLCVCVCVCAHQLWFWPELSFGQDTEGHRGGGGICLPLIGMCYWLTFTGAGPDASPHWEERRTCREDHLSLCQEVREHRPVICMQVCAGYWNFIKIRY